jgi:hypothetical protein
MDEILKLIGIVVFLDKDELVVNFQVHTFIQCYNQTPIKNLKFWEGFYDIWTYLPFNM